MLDSRLSNNVRLIINNSAQMAINMGEIDVKTEHLLWGITSVSNCVAAKILQLYGVNYNSVAEVMKSIKPEMKVKNIKSQIDLSPKVKSIINASFETSFRTNFDYVTSEHLLYCLLCDRQSMAVTLLTQNFNLDLNCLIQSTVTAISTGKVTKITRVEDEKNTYEQNKKEMNKRSLEDINSALPDVLKDMGIDMTARAKMGKMDPIIGRDKETNRIIEILCRKTKNNPVLIGEAGVGKTAVVEGLAQAIVKGEVPELLKNKIVFSMEMGSLMAGTKYRGTMEEKLKNAIKEITEAKNIIVFIDEIHTLAQAGSHDNELSPADMLKPYLARGEMQTIGATTTDEYRKFIEKDKALERRFQPIMVDEPTPEDAIKILKGIKDSYEGFHKVKITDDAIEAAVNLSVRYIMDRSLPDKAIDLIDEASSRAKVMGSIIPDDIKKLEKELKELEMRKKESEKAGDYTLTEQWKEKIKGINSTLLVRRNAWNASKDSQTAIVSVEDIAKVVSSWTNIPVSKLTESEKQKLLKLEEILHKRVIGQEEAVNVVSKAIRRARAGLKDPKRPIGSFIFLGPTGVGKTELTKALAEAMFDDENAVIRVDMSEYMESHSVSKLIGSPPGYVGFDDGGQLTEQVRRKPYSVVLFDEIEKAHPDIFNLMLQVLDEGRLTDSKGRTVSFKNTIIIMTSNVGVADLPKNTKKLGFNENSNDRINIKEKLMDSLRSKFKPEFLNRIDVIVIFESLKQNDIIQIAEIMLNNLNKKLKDHSIELRFTDEAKNQLAQEGYSETYGARPLKRLIEQKIEDQLAESLLSGQVKEKSKVDVDYKNGEFTFKSID